MTSTAAGSVAPRAARLPWVALAVSSALVVVSLPLSLGCEPLSDTLLYGLIALTVATTGALVASRQPDNPIGWIPWLLGAAVLIAIAGQELSTALFAIGMVLFLIGTAGSVASLIVRSVLGLAFLALPVAVGVAILRYRLYDIEVVINRTLVRVTVHLRDQVDLVDIGSDLLTVVRTTVQPAHASLWLRSTAVDR